MTEKVSHLGIQISKSATNREAFTILCTENEKVERLRKSLRGVFQLISSRDYSLQCGGTTGKDFAAWETNHSSEESLDEMIL